MTTQRRRSRPQQPIRDNLLRQLVLAREYRDGLYALGPDACAEYSISRAEYEVERLERLTNQGEDKHQ